MSRFSNQVDSLEQYHLTELNIALDPSDPRHLLFPSWSKDAGCWI